MNNRNLIRIIAGFVIYVAVYICTTLLPLESWFAPDQVIYVKLVAFLVPYLIVGYDVLWTAVRNIGHGQLFDENFLMSIATRARSRGYSSRKPSSTSPKRPPSCCSTRWANCSRITPWTGRASPSPH